MQPRVAHVQGATTGCVLANFRLSDFARAKAAAKQGGRDGHREKLNPYDLAKEFNR